MQATEINLLKFLKNSTRFAIPIYQRTYSWTKQQCQQLWDDILRTGSHPNDTAHFVGSIVYIQEGVFQIAQQTPFLVIDGQQRLTTVMLILEALARHVGDQEPVQGFSARKLRQYYLLNELEEEDQRFKLLLTQTDKATFLSLMEGGPVAPTEASIRITENFKFFKEGIDNLGDSFGAFCKGLSSLLIVDISLDRKQDNPQLIFESMNSTGLDLSQADLIRNFVLMGLKHKEQAKLYTTHWRPMEIEFGQEAYGKYFDGFMRHYLTMKNRELPNVGEVYKAFKDYATPKIKKGEVEALVADVRTYAGYYCAMALRKEQKPELADAFADIVKLKVDVAFPLLLELYGAYASGQLSAGDFESAIRLVESYVLRRTICEIPTNSQNKTFASFGRVLQKDRYLECIQVHFSSLPTYRRFPDDDEFCEKIIQRNIYTFRSRTYLLGKLENHNRKKGERVDVNECTIEHILPQNENLSKEWKKELGDDWQQVQKTWLHTLGNLTLTAYNAELSDRPFAYKRDMENGFKESPLHLNRGLGELQTWNESAIQDRAKKLAEKAVKVWAYPSASDAALQNYQPESEQSTGYTVEENHPHLAADRDMRPLFDAFRNELLALDPNVREEVRKHYIAYKVETNFVEIVAHVGRLQVLIDIPFPDIYDPKNMAEDVSDRGSLGTGDTRVYLSNTDNLRYVIGLVRQSYEKQLGSDESAT